ncbi:tdpoz3 [Trichonephila clavata]|uniref:Tdpoz3 n=1 Tax=Trichonephila clavata TaxID=2740835 RepID=A0A8X6HN48_TRICU|nr:tdpoz3 [Trichonephila clavata]
MYTDENVNCDYVFNWEIENFTFCWQKETKGIYSPLFSAESIENSKWILCLNPKGKDGNFISCYLKRAPTDERPPLIAVYFDLIFRNVNCSILQERYDIKHTFPLELGLGSHEFMARKDLILPSGTLIVSCRLRKSREKTTYVVEQCAKTVIKVDHKLFDWSVAKFTNMKLDEKKSLSFKLTSAGDLLSLDLFISSGEYSEEIILVSISSSLKIIRFVIVKLILKDNEGNMVECGRKEFYADTAENFKTLPLIFTKSKLLRKKDLYLKDDQLSLGCVCAFTTGVAYEGVSRTFSGNFKSIYEDINIQPKVVTEEKNTGCLQEELKSSYNDLALSDTMLRTETKSFPAHIAILSARSPVFRTMYSSGMKETIKRNVDILDLSDDTVQRMLIYMYTDTLESLRWESALLLYIAADKYGIMSLRNRCVSFIKKRLTTANVCEALTLAERHLDENFKRILQDYIANNQKEVLDLKEWKIFMKSNSVLAAEILYKICVED